MTMSRSNSWTLAGVGVGICTLVFLLSGAGCNGGGATGKGEGGSSGHGGVGGLTGSGGNGGHGGSGKGGGGGGQSAGSGGVAGKSGGGGGGSAGTSGAGGRAGDSGTAGHGASGGATGQGGTGGGGGGGMTGGSGGAGAGGGPGAGGAGGNVDYRVCDLATDLPRIDVFRVDRVAGTCTAFLFVQGLSTCVNTVSSDGWCLMSAGISRDVATCDAMQAPATALQADLFSGTFRVRTISAGAAVELVDIDITLQFPASADYPSTEHAVGTDCFVSCLSKDLCGS
jgi:hypothetical protein